MTNSTGQVSPKKKANNLWLDKIDLTVDSVGNTTMDYVIYSAMGVEN